jgi:hypothetical protein
MWHGHDELAYAPIECLGKPPADSQDQAEVRGQDLGRSRQNDHGEESSLDESV